MKKKYINLKKLYLTKKNQKMHPKKKNKIIEDQKEENLINNKSYKNTKKNFLSIKTKIKVSQEVDRNNTNEGDKK